MSSARNIIEAETPKGAFWAMRGPTYELLGANGFRYDDTMDAWTKTFDDTKGRQHIWTVWLAHDKRPHVRWDEVNKWRVTGQVKVGAADLHGYDTYVSKALDSPLQAVQLLRQANLVEAETPKSVLRQMAPRPLWLGGGLWMVGPPKEIGRGPLKHQLGHVFYYDKTGKYHMRDVLGEPNSVTCKPEFDTEAEAKAALEAWVTRKGLINTKPKHERWDANKQPYYTDT